VPGINELVWQYGVIYGVQSANVLFVVLAGLAYDKATDKCRQGAVAGACTVANDTLQEDFALFFGLTSFSNSILWLNYPMWLQG